MRKELKYFINQEKAMIFNNPIESMINIGDSSDNTVKVERVDLLYRMTPVNNSVTDTGIWGFDSMYSISKERLIYFSIQNHIRRWLRSAFSNYDFKIAMLYKCIVEGDIYKTSICEERAFGRNSNLKVKVMDKMLIRVEDVVDFDIYSLKAQSSQMYKYR